MRASCERPLMRIPVVLLAAGLVLTLSPEVQAAKKQKPAELAAPTADKKLPFYSGLHFEVLHGFLAVRAAVDPLRATVDPFLGARVGYRRQLGPVVLGGEGLLRATPVANVGTNPILPVQIIGRSLGGKPWQVLRQTNQVGVGGTLAYRLKRLDWFVEPFVMGGLSHSFRTVLVELDSPILYNRSYPALGMYGGFGFMTGLEPVFCRMDAVLNPEVGPPPFTSRLFQAQYNIGLGIRL